MTVPASVDTGFDITPVTATVNPALAPTSVETGFSDLDGTLASLQPTAPTANTVADTGTPDADVDLDVRVAALLPTQSVTDWNAISTFLAAVVPWPSSVQDPGYVNLHYSAVDRKNPTGPLRKGGGWPFQMLSDFISRAGWVNNHKEFKDVWFCLSLQSQLTPNPHKPHSPKAKRLSANALAVKAVWIDVDVEPGNPNKYGSINEALNAIIAFTDSVGLPMPSALVGSGGGIHVYWISTIALSVAEWMPYADGLKQLLLRKGLNCDAGITTDVARILRVPGTLNHKRTHQSQCSCSTCQW